MMKFICFLTILLLGLSHPKFSFGSVISLPSFFSDTVENPNADINFPTAMALAPDGRIFVCEQMGNLRVIKNGVLLSTPFYSYSSIDMPTDGERGLLGVALDPQFNSNHYLYLYNTHIEPSASVTFSGAITLSGPVTYNRISRLTADSLNPDVAQIGSETVILNIHPLGTATYHNGGAIRFGLDGKLYAGTGDNSTGSNSQDLTNLLGKIIRINADGSIPVDNPFYVTGAENLRAIWALGLRNPFTFNLQPGTGRFFINDVGNNTWEEINEGLAGYNYGWPSTEGNFNPALFPAFTLPTYTYNSAGSGPTSVDCAITGGAFYNPVTAQFPSAYTGKYFFADYCGGWIRTLDSPLPPAGTPVSLSSSFATGYSWPVGLEVAMDGTLEILTGAGTGTGKVHKVSYSPGPTATPINTPVPQKEGLRFSPAFPVPSFGDPISVSVSYPENYTVEWKVFTLGGLRIKSGNFTARNLSLIQWDLKDDWGKISANGLYFFHVEIQTGEGKTTKNFKVLVFR